MAHLGINRRSFGKHNGLVIHLHEVFRIRLGYIIGLGDFLIIDSFVLVIGLSEKS